MSMLSFPRLVLKVALILLLVWVVWQIIQVLLFAIGVVLLFLYMGTFVGGMGSTEWKEFIQGFLGALF